jgi:hypothetical protein
MKYLNLDDAASKKHFNRDDAVTLYFDKQLTQIASSMLETQYAELEAERLLPNRIQVDPVLDYYEFRRMDVYGEAVPLAGKEDGAPVLNMQAFNEIHPLQAWGKAYEFSIDEIRKSARFGMDLQSQGAQAARRLIAEKLNMMALIGYSPRGIKGLFNQANTLTEAPTGAWSGLTSSQLLTDLINLSDDSEDNTLSILRPKRIALPKVQYRLVESKIMSVDNSMTVLNMFKSLRPNVEVVSAHYLDTAGSGATTRAVAYDPSLVSWLVANPFEQLPPEAHGYQIAVNCMGKGGGVVTAQPLSISYMDGI